MCPNGPIAAFPTHVVPINDLKSHVTVGRQCWCNPKLEEDGALIIHNSADGREKFETGERKRS